MVSTAINLLYFDHIVTLITLAPIHSNMSTHNLGVDAYADPDSNNGDLLKNLEGCRVHRFSPGTGEHAGTALMIVELSTGDGLGVQVEMDTLNDRIPVYPCTQSDDGTWTAESLADYRDHDAIETECPDLEIIEVTQHNIMGPETARVLVILDSDTQKPFGIDIYLHDDGTDFFEIEL